MVTGLFVVGAMLPGALRETISKTFYLRGVDPYAHFVFCALIALLLRWSGVPMLRVVLSVLALGALIEVVQLWIPGRSTSWNDMANDAAGMALGLFLMWLSQQFMRRGRDG
ncbi:hypothetical protein A11A3_14395 [Alcanivorax hongdengensis A-11-3]|uniref:VanZ-like domain-containing protein n=1 Tax=Alcanivorax hongdengensis A-11-3 TaxID=1177179 RepID=L0W8I6_9GAMM|nr:hypothetical protein A11A3_14395 [Alcanivorax hongdengensis A-11-3]